MGRHVKRLTQFLYQLKVEYRQTSPLERYVKHAVLQVVVKP